MTEDARQAPGEAAGVGDRLRSWLAGVEPDPRALACLRIGTGLALLWDMVLALSVAGDWWALQGHTPASLPDWLPTTSTLVLAALGVAAVALALILGWQTPWTTAAAWVSACAYQFAADGSGDFHSELLCLLLLWSLLLPTEQTLSLDGRISRPRSLPAWRLRLGAAGLLVTLAAVYLSTTLSKSGDAWWGEGSAVWLALMDRSTPSAAGRWLALAAPSWLWPVATWTVLLLEGLAAPALLWRRTRGAAVVALTAMHLATWGLMNLGAFPLTAIAGLLAVAPGWLWDRLGWRRPAPRPPGVTRRRDLGLVAAVAVVLLASAEGLRVTEIRRAGDPWPYPGARQVARLYYLSGFELDWHMYGPEPLRAVGWWVVCAWDGDGRAVDPLTGRAPALTSPAVAGADARLRWMGLSHPPTAPRGPQDTLLRLARRRPGAERLAVVWLHEELRPFGPPAPAVPILARVWPAGAVTAADVAGVLGAEVFAPAYDPQTGRLTGIASGVPSGAAR